MKQSPVKITLNPVKKSSQVHSIGYDQTSKTMAVKFNSGGVYHYHDVPQEKFNAMRDAESAGSHLGKHIKGAHKYVRIDDAEKS